MAQMAGLRAVHKNQCTAMVVEAVQERFFHNLGRLVWLLPHLAARFTAPDIYVTTNGARPGLSSYADKSFMGRNRIEWHNSKCRRCNDTRHYKAQKLVDDNERWSFARGNFPSASLLPPVPLAGQIGGNLVPRVLYGAGNVPNCYWRR